MPRCRQIAALAVELRENEGGSAAQSGEKTGILVNEIAAPP
jgi:hypothetical protein